MEIEFTPFEVLRTQKHSKIHQQYFLGKKINNYYYFTDFIVVERVVGVAVDITSTCASGCNVSARLYQNYHHEHHCNLYLDSDSDLYPFLSCSTMNLP